MAFCHHRLAKYIAQVVSKPVAQFVGVGGGNSNGLYSLSWYWLNLLNVLYLVSMGICSGFAGVIVANAM
jgi:hypothetical protein